MKIKLEGSIEFYKKLTEILGLDKEEINLEGLEKLKIIESDPSEYTLVYLIDTESKGESNSAEIYTLKAEDISRDLLKQVPKYIEILAGMENKLLKYFAVTVYPIIRAWLYQEAREGMYPQIAEIGDRIIKILHVSITEGEALKQAEKQGYNDIIEFHLKNYDFVKEIGAVDSVYKLVKLWTISRIAEFGREGELHLPESLKFQESKIVSLLSDLIDHRMDPDTHIDKLKGLIRISSQTVPLLS